MARAGADLFLYAGSAEQAFASAARDVRKVLFMYHPRVRPSAAILRQDMKRYPVAQDVHGSLAADLADESNDRELTQSIVRRPG